MRVVIILLLLAASALGSPRKDVPRTWAGLTMHGLIMDLQDPHYTQWLSFNGSGDVLATEGAKDGPYGAYTTSIGYAWRVRGAWLEFMTSRDKPFRRLRAISVSNDRLVTRTGTGETAIYKIKRAPKT